MNFLVSSLGILDSSLNVLLSIATLSELHLKYSADRILIPNKSYIINILFGIVIIDDRVFFNYGYALYSILVNDLINKQTDSFKLEIPYIDNGTHYIFHNSNKLYIQETYLNRFSIYDLDISNNIDSSSIFIPNIYPKAVNPRFRPYPTLLDGLYLNDYPTINNNLLDISGYRHINSALIIPDITNTLICSSSFLRNGPIIDNNPTNIPVNSTIDYIDMSTWTYNSYEVNEYAIHDLRYFNGYIYYISNKNLYKFDPYTKSYIGVAYNHISSIDSDSNDPSNNYITRGLWFDLYNNKAHYYYNWIISRNVPPNPEVIRSKNYSIHVEIELDSNNIWNLVKEEKIEDCYIYYATDKL